MKPGEGTFVGGLGVLERTSTRLTQLIAKMQGDAVIQ